MNETAKRAIFWMVGPYSITPGEWRDEPCPCGDYVCKQRIIRNPCNVDGRFTAEDALVLSNSKKAFALLMQHHADAGDPGKLKDDISKLLYETFPGMNEDMSRDLRAFEVYTPVKPPHYVYRVERVKLLDTNEWESRYFRHELGGATERITKEEYRERA